MNLKINESMPTNRFPTMGDMKYSPTLESARVNMDSKSYDLLFPPLS